MSVIETSPAAGTWTVDPVHSSVEFAVRHMGIATVRGRFPEFEGTLDGSGEAPKLEGVVRVASVTTDDEQRDGHLRSPDFFDVERHPEITFTSTRFDESGGKVRVRGDFTLRGVTREIELTGELRRAHDRLALELEGGIDRRDFGLVWNQALPGGGFVLDDEVRLLLSFSAVEDA